MASSQGENADPTRTSATPPAPSTDPVAGAADPFERVLAMVRFLRVNCPWDREQTPRSLLPYLLEEAHEVAHHVEDGDDDALAGELGDLLLHVAFQAALAEERGAFGPHEPAERVLDKMRRRHPHLFGLGEARDWEEMKAEERAAASATDTAASFSHLDNLATGLDPLALAHRIQDRVSSVGFDWDDPSGAFAKVREEVEEVAELAASNDRATLEEEIGDLLFAVVNYARLAGVHADLALRAANEKFGRRFRALEQLAPQRGVVVGDATLAELDRLWDEVKAAERTRGG